MKLRSALILTITAPVASIALAQMYPAPQPKSNPALTAPPTSTTAPAPAAPATAAPSAQSAAAAPGMPSVPPPACAAPQYPGKNAPNDKIKKFNETYKDYGDCIRKYVDSVRTLANTAIASGNDAVTAYNKYTEEIKQQLDADK